MRQIELASVKVEKTEMGVIVKVKSEAMERFFKANSSETREINGRNYHVIEDHKVSRESLEFESDGMLIDCYHISEKFLYGEKYIVSFLSMVGIGEGVEIKFDGLFEKKKLMNLYKAIKYSVQFIYINYMKPFKVECDIISHERQEIS